MTAATLIGAFLSVEVALTVTNSVIKIQDSSGAPKADLTSGHGYELLMGTPGVRDRQMASRHTTEIRATRE